MQVPVMGDAGLRVDNMQRVLERNLLVRGVAAPAGHRLLVRLVVEEPERTFEPGKESLDGGVIDVLPPASGQLYLLALLRVQGQVVRPVDHVEDAALQRREQRVPVDAGDLVDRAAGGDLRVEVLEEIAAVRTGGEVAIAGR